MSMVKLNSEEAQNLYQSTKTLYDEFVSQNLSLNMARGKPGADQLDMSKKLLDCVNSDTDLNSFCSDDIRNYGIWDGLPQLKDIFAQIMDVPASSIILGNNSSLELMFEVISRGYSHGFMGNTPWSKLEKIKFLCPVPGYDRHFAISEYFGTEMINIPIYDNGPDIDMIEKLVESDESIKGIWCIPKYSNPSGITYSDEVVSRLANLNPLAKDFVIMWDNAYCVHDLTDTPDNLLSIYNECLKNGKQNMLFNFASSSKITFPGSGVSAFAMGEKLFKDMESTFTIRSIGPDKVNQLRHTLFMKDKAGVAEIMQKHRAILEPKFNKVCEILEEQLGSTDYASWNTPNGGYFVSVNVEDGCAKRVVELCKNAGVVLTGAGATFPYGKDPKNSNIRIAPTFPPVNELETAMKLFCVCVKLAVYEKYMKK